MFRITSHIVDSELVLKLEGCLCGDWVPELDAYWRVTGKTPAGRVMRVDLTDVCHVDEAGRALMTVMYRAGVRFVARGCVMPEVVREISETASGGRN